MGLNVIERKQKSLNKIRAKNDAKCLKNNSFGTYIKPSPGNEENSALVVFLFPAALWLTGTGGYQYLDP